MNCTCKKCGANFTSKLALAFYSMFSICCLGTYSQNCNNKLSVEVIDLHDGSALSNATVVIKELDISKNSNKDGLLVFENLCDGDYNLSVAHEDCETYSVKVVVKKDIFKKVFLEHHLNELQEIIVTSSNRINSKSLFENKISKEVLDDYNSRTLGEVLQTITGVSTLNSGSYLSKPVINGLHSSRVILINNDVRLEDQEWGIEHAPSIDINSIDKLSVIKGRVLCNMQGMPLGVLLLQKHLEKN